METKRRSYVVGPDPVHKHTSPSDGSVWECNSPYCIALEIDRPEDGGPNVVTKGQEPWRGRQ